MVDDPGTDFEAFREDLEDWSEPTAILEEAQFARGDVLAVTGLTEAQLKNTLDRDLVRLASDHNPGTGRRRLFTGGDILKIVVAHIMSAIGFPMKWSYLVADEVERRAANRLIGLVHQSNLKIVTFPRLDGDWERVPLYDGMATPPPLPVVYQTLEIDRLIDQVIAKLAALIADQPLPNFDVPLSQPAPSPWSPENDFFRRWHKDDQGRDVLVGLTYEETVEYQNLQAARLSQPDEFDDRRRFLELHDKHESVRLERVAREGAARLRDMQSK